MFDFGFVRAEMLGEDDFWFEFQCGCIWAGHLEGFGMCPHAYKLHKKLKASCNNS